MDDFVAILKTEYSTAFDEHRKKAMINSFYRFVFRNTRRLATQNTL